MSSTPAQTTTAVVLKEHAYYCFDVIFSKLHKTPLATASFNVDLEFPLFVTWNIQSRRSTHSSRLRGCIGTFEASPVGRALKDYAEISAFKDTRFAPINIEELERLDCCVSFLTDFEICENYLDWEVGTHGIYIEFPCPDHYPEWFTALPSSNPFPTLTPNETSTSLKSFNSISSLPPYQLPSSPSHSNQSRRKIWTATYLPEVAEAQGWSKVEAIDSAIQKAGYNETVREGMRRSMRISRYKSEKIEVGHGEWKVWKESQFGK